MCMHMCEEYLSLIIYINICLYIYIYIYIPYIYIHIYIYIYIYIYHDVVSRSLALSLYLSLAPYHYLFRRHAIREGLRSRPRHARPAGSPILDNSECECYPECDVSPIVDSSECECDVNPNVDNRPATSDLNATSDLTSDERHECERRPHSPAAVAPLLVRLLALAPVLVRLLELVCPAGAGGVVPVQ
jgi:hypothetical protein